MSKSKTSLQKFYTLYDQERWKEGRAILFKLLKKEPESHWLFSRISSTFYEEYDYKNALRFAQKAVSISPRCPLALMDLAGALNMLGHNKEAIGIWKKLLRRNIESLAYGECGEGIRSAEEIQNSARLRIGFSYKNMGKIKLAKRYILEHLKHRKRGLFCNYSKREVIKFLKSLDDVK